MSIFPTEEEIRDLLTRYSKITVVGLSPKSSRPSHGVTEYMIRQGYEIVGVRPAQSRILDRPVYPSLKEVPEDQLEIVDVFRNSDAIPDLVDEILALKTKPKVLWLQEGVHHPEAEARAREAGITVVADRCILKEHSRLL